MSVVRPVAMLRRVMPVPPSASRRILARRLARNATLVGALVFAAVGIGATGYHVFDACPGSTPP